MRSIVVAALVAAGTLAAGGCARSTAYPVVVRDPVPPPPAGYAVACETSRWVGGITTARCRPAAVPVTVVRARS